MALPLVVACALVLALLPAVRKRLAYMREAGGTADREMIWRVCGAVIEDHPLTGVGWGNYPRRSLPYYARFPNKTEMRAWCHDTFMSAWAEGGPLLFAAACAYWALLLRAFWRLGRRAGDPLARGAAAGALVVVVTALLAALLHDVFYASESMYGLGFAVAVAAVLAESGTSHGEGPPRAKCQERAEAT